VLTQLVSELLGEGSLVLLDVGATGGIHPRWNLFGDNLESILVDADEEQEISQIDDYVFTAFGEKASTRSTFYLTNKRECSSILKPNYSFLKKFHDVERFFVDKEKNVSLTTIDDFISRSELESVDFLKIDAQGYSYEILKGAENSLEKTVLGVEVELEFSSLYQDQKLFSDSFRYLTDLGFELVDLSPVKWQHLDGTDSGAVRGGAQLIFCDAFFVKSLNQPSVANLKSLKKVASILIAYGYFNYAAGLIKRSETDLSINEQDFYSLSSLEELLNNSLVFGSECSLSGYLELYRRYHPVNDIVGILRRAINDLSTSSVIKKHILQFLRVHDLEDKIRELLESNGELREKVALSNEKYSSLLESNSELREKVALSNEKYSSLLESNGELREKVALSNEKYASLLESNSELREKVALSNEKYSSLLATKKTNG
jgi:FkbM family methyltransferase